MKDFIIPSDRDFGTPYVRSTVTVTLNIDGFDVTVPEGTSVMRASAEAVHAVVTGVYMTSVTTGTSPPVRMEPL